MSDIPMSIGFGVLGSCFAALCACAGAEALFWHRWHRVAWFSVSAALAVVAALFLWASSARYDHWASIHHPTTCTPAAGTSVGEGR